jgi:predicted membrane protein
MRAMVAAAADFGGRDSLADPRKFPEGGEAGHGDGAPGDESMNSDPLRDYEREAQREESPESHAAASQSGVVTAIVIIIAGIALLLHQLGMLPHNFMPHIWPTIFILAGVLMVVNATSSQSKVLYGVLRGTKVGGKTVRVLRQDPTASVLLGVALVAAGVILELNARGITDVGWEVFWPLVIIGVGASMLWRHARPAKAGGEDEASTVDYPFDLNFVFSGTDRQIYDKDFKGGRVNAVFGGFKLDLVHADIRNEAAVLEVNAVFGGGEIRIPDTWAVELQGSSVFGALEDKTRRYQPDPTQPPKTLIVKGAVVFGGVVVKN